MKIFCKVYEQINFVMFLLVSDAILLLASQFCFQLNPACSHGLRSYDIKNDTEAVTSGWRFFHSDYNACICFHYECFLNLAFD